MVGTMQEDYIPNLIDSMLLNMGISDTGFLLIKHYNTFDLSAGYIRSLAMAREEVCFLYHSYDVTAMSGAYEPVLSAVGGVPYLYLSQCDKAVRRAFGIPRAARTGADFAEATGKQEQILRKVYLGNEYAEGRDEA